MPRHTPPLPYRRAPELDGPQPTVPVVIVGAGPAGLALAIDLALRGVACTVLGDSDQLSPGARAICWAQRTLEILDRLGVGETVLAQAVPWQVSRIYHGTREIAAIDYQPEPGHRMPAFANLQQYLLEEALLARCADFANLIDLRFRHRVTGLEAPAKGLRLQVYTEDGRYTLQADWCVACDGARSAVRGMLGLDFPGNSFDDRFLIADVACDATFPAERRFWFDPPFHPGQTALLHAQPKGMLRLELQLGPGADVEAERLPQAIAPRLQAIIGDTPHRVLEARVWRFACRRMARFVHDRVIFAGDSAHVMPPFGARGGNSSLQDADNLGWKLAAVVHGVAGPGLLDSYDTERSFAADDNIAHATRAAGFLVPPTPGARALRDEVLMLAADNAFARRMVNPGRLSSPSSLAGFPLQTQDDAAMATAMGAAMQPGSPCIDAPLGEGWLLNHLGGDFCLLCIDTEPPDLPEGTPLKPVRVGQGGLADSAGLVAARYGRGVYLVRPDQHVAARWASPRAASVLHARDRALGG